MGERVRAAPHQHNLLLFQIPPPQVQDTGRVPYVTPDTYPGMLIIFSVLNPEGNDKWRRHLLVTSCGCNQLHIELYMDSVSVWSYFSICIIIIIPYDHFHHYCHYHSYQILSFLNTWILHTEYLGEDLSCHLKFPNTRGWHFSVTTSYIRTWTYKDIDSSCISFQELLRIVCISVHPSLVQLPTTVVRNINHP